MKDIRSNSSVWQRGVSAVSRIVLIFGAMVVVIATLLFGLALAVAIVLWALLRGRRPGPVNLRWRRMPRTRGVGSPMRNGMAGEVVDVQVHEVQSPPLR